MKRLFIFILTVGVIVVISILGYTFYGKTNVVQADICVNDIEDNPKTTVSAVLDIPMKETHSNKPYFVMWVNNSQVMLN